MKEFQKTSFFQSNSPWAEKPGVEPLPHMGRQSPLPTDAQKTRIELTVSELEDWENRIQQAADEAGDEHLLALETDLLGLRDEIRELL